jgi:signal transduction histidine kinase
MTNDMKSFETGFSNPPRSGQETDTAGGHMPEGRKVGLAASPPGNHPSPGDSSSADLAQQIERLREQLKTASRHASMAEVATGALHNVGNVLNSVNVSVSLVANRLRQSRIYNLSKALSLLREHQTHLAEFLKDDPKGKMLPSYLETLTDHLTAEHAELVREMETVTRNIEHIKEIVGVQQSYSRLCGVLESLPIAELVQDAIRMNLAAFERHGITIVREFAPVPPVTVDRHKVLQILINLIRNAKYAMDELGPAEKRLTISICKKGSNRVIVGIRDNGIGIAPENLRRIFEHGFTTKRDGHGFGLSSGAVAAREMGGELTAYSEGPGQGAIFCLELPIPLSPPDHSADGNGKASHEH